MSDGVLVFDDEPVLVLEDGGAAETSLILDERQDVLVFDVQDETREVEELSDGDFLLFDAPPPVLQVVEAPQDFLLVDADPVPAEVVMDDDPEADVLIMSSGPPGAPGKQGEPGPVGPPGMAGAGAYYQAFGFATPQQVWTVVHNLGTYGVSVEVVDTNGDPMEGFVRYVDANTIEIDWYYPTAGEARLFR